jgi:ADP-ribosylglycohydrolase
MQRVLERIDDALDDGHVVYLHCRAGIGRSATVAGCWLSRHGRNPQEALEELQRLWQQSAKSGRWPQVPETDEQTDFVRRWTTPKSAPAAPVHPGPTDFGGRVRGAWLGLAAGDAAGAIAAGDVAEVGRWTQHTALALCLAESLLERGRMDARDQIERYLRWQRDGYLSASAVPGPVSPDIAKALAVYAWRGQPLAGSHDPRDRSTSALPRVVAAVTSSLHDVAGAVQSAGECARTTHQSPLVVDSCRYFGAMLAGALLGDPPQAVFDREYEPAPGLWAARPLKPAVRSMSRTTTGASLPKRSRMPDAVRAVAAARSAVAAGAGFEDCVRRACRSAAEPALEAALAGALWGALHGASTIPSDRLASLARPDLLESTVERMLALCPPLPATGQPAGLAP